MLKWNQMRDNTDGKAAATGRATGRAVELWIRHASIEEAVATALEEAKGGAHLPDPDEVMATLLGYAADPRNAQGGLTPSRMTPDDPGITLLESLEQEVLLVLPPHESDPTGEECVFLGHLDQLRRDPMGRLVVWDLKHSNRNAMILNFEYALQLAGYARAVERSYGEPCEVGGILLSTRYLNPKGRSKDAGPRTVAAEPQETFLKSTLTRVTVSAMMDDVRKWVAEIRSGRPSMNPGERCNAHMPRHCFGGPEACRRVYESASQEPSGLFAN